ncbi:DUF4184 family protein [Phytohabitans houttuyneae]|uniref:DUF4184 domain-containing protein n=1 Tax=Phytohabitans houttuyneae TaxID=1076126 RepID=A0A6V8KL17_9ACTN|nr:DUF4184 family protein [Phytohabitans houttuyneae]GFJ82447.1 hypothetical protein Phou_066270 [Phytohabitans houttuyneae]
MPLTLPTHPVAVLPLKLWRPRWFDGVALVLGAVAPDLPYAVEGYGVTIHSHAWHAPLWWALPVVLVGARVVRWAAPVVAAHLPAGGPLALRDYGVLGGVRHPWWVTAWSAVLGAASHIVWDAFTHPYVDGGRLLFPWLHEWAVPGMSWWEVLVIVSDVAGFAVGAGLALHLGSARLLRRWHGPPRAAPHLPGTFWLAVSTVAAAGIVPLPFLPGGFLPGHAIRCLLVAGLALLAGAAAVRLRAAVAAVSP